MGLRTSLIFLAVAALTAPAAAQVVLDRADPAVIERDLRRAEDARPSTDNVQATTEAKAGSSAVVSVTAGAIIVESDVFSNGVFAPVIAPYLGRVLDADALQELLSKVAGVARSKGYLFATASIQPQSVSAGVLRINLDEGRIDAVRSLGSPNAQVDAILRQLVSKGPVRRVDFERALLLAGDVAGVRVTDTRYVRQDGFGILFVTLADDRTAFSLQIDNRGTDIVGPVRATAVASTRGMISEGDEASLLIANTPFDPSELIFAQLKYAAPIDARGNLLWSSAAVGHTRPGASLAPFKVKGDSFSLATGLSHPLVRSRGASLWSSIELRGLWLDQEILGVRVRRDRVVTLSAGLEGAARWAGGVLRGNAAIVVGLPIADVTHKGDPLASRGDGDARFGRLELYGDWTRDVTPDLSIRLAAAGQIATRPVLASQEFGLGGSLFGRAYDYSERSGENGVAGSAEARLNVSRDGAGAIRRVQLYSFADAGHVENAHSGLGGGTLISAGGGLRFGIGRTLNGEAELAVPIGADRISSGNRHPRISIRLTASF
jgi:hemolysin activation/secretion protein